MCNPSYGQGTPATWPRDQPACAGGYAMLWDYLKTLIMLRLTLQAPCMCAVCKGGGQRLKNNREHFRLPAFDAKLNDVKEGARAVGQQIQILRASPERKGPPHRKALLLARLG